jgi:thiamine-monophosphate kinase
VYKRQIFATSDPRVHIGIGDDAAVVSVEGKSVITTDMAVEGTHFRKEWSSAIEIGHKIAVANLADIYAMGAKPDYLVVALSLTGDEELEWVLDIARGIQEQVSKCGASVVGGDLTRGGAVTISITAIGSVEEPITRSGARSGDSLYISGLPGWSAAGLHLIRNSISPSTRIHEKAINQFKLPFLDEHSSSSLLGATSLCDISDSLLTQAQQISRASSVEIEIDINAFKTYPEFKDLESLAEQVGVDVWAWILGGGEDHLFLGTGKDLPAFRIGRVYEGIGVKVPEMKKAPDTWRHFS